MEFLISFLITFPVGYIIGWYLAKPKEMPYRWECMREDCTFKCSSNSMNLTMSVADKHERMQHG